jgi:hypothetical protein
MDDPIPRDVPFSLTCQQCDAGMEIETYEEALAQGWLDITNAPDLPMANFLGLCPECRREEERLNAS